jgi:mRNA export factor
MVFGSVAAAPAQLGSYGSSGPNASCAPGDHCVAQAGSDGISSINWSPTANHVVSTNWDGGVRCWEVQESGQQIRALPMAQGELL